MFANSPDVQLNTIKDGQHTLSALHPEEVDKALVKSHEKHHKKLDVGGSEILIFYARIVRPYNGGAAGYVVH